MSSRRTTSPFDYRNAPNDSRNDLNFRSPTDEKRSITAWNPSVHVPLRLLIVEDSEDDAQLLLTRLRREGIVVDAVRVDTADAMRAALGGRQWDVVVSDFSMPAFSAIAARALLSEAGLDIPFIIVSGTIGEETAVSALKNGAHDFLTKSNLSRLVPAIERELRDAEERHRRRAAEGELSETRERMRFALEASSVGTWEVDLVRGTQVWSSVEERLHGLRAGQFGGTLDALMNLIHPSDRERVRNESAQLFRARADTRIEYRVIWADGSVHWISSIGHAFHDGEGRPVRAAGISLEITHQKELQEQLFQAQKMESIGNLAGGIAHDFNNMLTVISGCCQLLDEHEGLDPNMRRDLQEIRNAVDRGAALTRQLLASSRKQVLAPQIVNLNDIVGNVGTMLQRLIEENIHLENRLASDLAQVHVDRGQMEQVLVNLAVNARDAMPEGGTLTIETANVRLDEEYADAHMDVRAGPHVRLSVSDTGTGMSPDVREHIFEPFFTTKAKGQGTGLGLATVYGIVKQSGGHIFVYSEPGRGATFKLYFPAVSGEALVEAPKPRAAPAALGGTETILLVEDDARLRALEERILTRYGYHVLMAASAAEAMRIATEHRGPIHVVLTDVIMPGGSGRTLGDWVAEHRPHTTVIYMSGYTDNAIARHGLLEPGTHFLQKPFSPEGLARKVREALS